MASNEGIVGGFIVTTWGYDISFLWYILLYEFLILHRISVISWYIVWENHHVLLPLPDLCRLMIVTYIKFSLSRILIINTKTDWALYNIYPLLVLCDQPSLGVTVICFPGSTSQALELLWPVLIHSSVCIIAANRVYSHLILNELTV